MCLGFEPRPTNGKHRQNHRAIVEVYCFQVAISDNILKSIIKRWLTAPIKSKMVRPQHRSWSNLTRSTHYLTALEPLERHLAMAKPTKRGMTRGRVHRAEA